MKKSDVEVGKVYVVKVSGKLSPVRLDYESPYGGWVGTNLNTGRDVRVKTAARLRREYLSSKASEPVTETVATKVDV